MECEGAHGICSQFHSVHQGHLNEAIGLSAAGWPILITLHLEGGRAGQGAGYRRQCYRMPKGLDRQKQSEKPSSPDYRESQPELSASSSSPNHTTLSHHPSLTG